MSSKRVGILLGRGVEGCGVTKFALEQNKWLKKHGMETVIFATIDKSWTRKNAHEFEDVQLVKISKPEDADLVISELNTCDYVICNSLPSKGHPAETIEAFARIIEAIDVPFILVQHDHKAQSILRNRCLGEVIDKADLIFVHSVTNDFAKYVKAHQGSGALDVFFGDEYCDITGFQPGLFFDEVRDRFWKPIKEQDAFHHKWIGRTTSWKGYNKIFPFHEGYLRPYGCLTSLEGIERSPAFIAFKELGEFTSHVAENSPIDSVDLSEAYGEPLQVFGPYVHDEMLERMSRCAFGYQLSVMQQPYLERSIEYTHCEIVCAGVVPVFREAFGQRCHHRVTGDPLVECPDSGTIWLSDEVDRMSVAFDLIQMLEQDPMMRDDWRHKAYEFYKEHQDAEHTFAEMNKKIEDALNA